MKQNKFFSFLYQYAEAISFGLCVVWLTTVIYYHEPWFDDIQAWQIARYASLSDILFTLPHYEGHPPLWHLLLLIPAKLGFFFTYWLKPITWIFSVACGYLLVYKSPFPRWIRCLVPFTYFPLYQYGTSLRPYSLFAFLFMLSAIYFPSRNQHPFRFVCILILLCLTHAYGIIFAAGIAAAWLVDIYHETSHLGTFVSSIRHDRRLQCLGVLLLTGVIMVALVWPAPDTFANNIPVLCPFWHVLLYAIFIAPADAFLTDFYHYPGILTQHGHWDKTTLVAGVLIGCILWGVVWFRFNQKQLKYLVIPSLFMTGAIISYYAVHHCGLVFLLWGWFLWAMFAEEQRSSSIQPFSPWVKDIKKTVYSLLVLWFVFSITQSMHASWLNMHTPIAKIKNLAVFLREHQLDRSKIMGSWLADPAYPNTNMIAFAVELGIYFDRNVVYNNQLMYRSHKVPSFEENKKNLSLWREAGLPDIILGEIDFKTAFGKKSVGNKYVPVYVIKGIFPWKWDELSRTNVVVYARKDLLQSHQLERISIELFQRAL